MKEYHLEPGINACRRALELINDSAHSDPCLVAELKTTYGTCCMQHIIYIYIICIYIFIYLFICK